MRKGKTGRFRWRGVLLTVLGFAAMVFALVFALSQVDDRNESEQAKILQEAVLRATLTCYAIEGRYPPNVQYIEKNYGIVYDSDKFFVKLDSFAPNILPSIFVLSAGGAEYE